MLRSGTLSRIALTVLTIGLTTGAVSASRDELYYPASMCHPFNGTDWEGGGSSGFGFRSSEGGWYNFDNNADEPMACPVPYFRNTNRLDPITVRLVVDDGHRDKFIRAWLCGKTSTGGKFCDSTDNFPNIIGVSTMELSIQPRASTRFVWIEVLVPETYNDGNSRTGNQPSGIIGYRVIRN